MHSTYHYTESLREADMGDMEKSYPLRTAADLTPLLERIGDARYVLLGEASHGTHEYYTWRTAISKRLIEEKGFHFIAVEGDWPDCYKLNRFIKGYSQQDKTVASLLHTFNRWPTWMWANWEVVALLTWLKDYNARLSADKKIGFYGLDLYSLWESMQALVKYLEKTDVEAARLAKNAIRCFEPYGEEGQRYAMAQYTLPQACRESVIQLLREIRLKAASYNHDPEAALNSEQNAHIAVNAEEYYRNMIGFNENAWNLRDTHMVETFNRLLAFHGPAAKGIVWEHNTHIGDARFTDMHEAGMINVGQLVREQHGEAAAVLVGFGSYEGTVIAGKKWSAPMKTMTIPKAIRGSVEALLHHESATNRLLIFDRTNTKERFCKTLPHRAIGVVYNPSHEQHGNYVPSRLNGRYDAWLYVDKTQALHPLQLEPDGHKTPETYPFNY